MGHGRVGRAVADAGPLIHLHEVGRSELLRLFDSLSIPDAVWAESVGKGRIPALNQDNIRRHRVADGDVEHFVQAQSLGTLHVGERGGLFLCQQLDVSLLFDR